MSDNWISLIPEDPRFVPDSAKLEQARELFARIAPDADGIEATTTESIEFIDCGANFELVVCPACKAEISMSWWQLRMDEDYGDGFRLAAYATPCCGHRCTLHELHYDFTQGFGRFILEAMNPNIGELEDRYRAQFEAVLGTQLRVIYRHL